MHVYSCFSIGIGGLEVQAYVWYSKWYMYIMVHGVDRYWYSKWHSMSVVKYVAQVHISVVQ